MRVVGKPYKYTKKRHHRRVKRKVLRAWKKTGLQHHIVPYSGDNAVLIVNNRWLKVYNKKVRKSKRLTIKYVLENAYFSTPVSNRLVVERKGVIENLFGRKFNA